MSLYNQLFGVNPHAGAFLGMLGIKHFEVPRFRDCHLNAAGEIVILTRTGDGNRAQYGDQNARLRTLPGFLGDTDSEYDPTYASFRYAVPEQHAEIVQVLTKHGGVDDPMEKFKALVEKMKQRGNDDDPEVQRAMEIGARIMAEIREKPEDDAD